MGLDAKNFGLAGAILFGAVMFILTIISAATGYANQFLMLVSTIYPGYTVTYLGSLVGLIYGVIDGFIGCYIFVWIYNWLEEQK